MAPEILIQPVDTLVTQPENASLTCAATGRPRPIIQWNIAGNQSLVPLVSTAGIYNISETEIGEREIVSNLTIIKTDPFDTATYVCNASNVVNATLAAAALTVYGMPFKMCYEKHVKDGLGLTCIMH